MKRLLFKIHIVLLAILLFHLVSVLAWLLVIMMGYSDNEFSAPAVFIIGICIGIVGLVRDKLPTRGQRWLLPWLIAWTCSWIVGIFMGHPFASILPNALTVLFTAATSLITMLLLLRYVTRVSPSMDAATIFSSACSWIIRCFGLVFIIFIVVFPLYYLISTSMKPRAEILNNPLDLSINFEKGLQTVLLGYSEIFGRFSFGRYIINSAIVSVLTVLLTLIPSIAGAYAVTRLHFPGKNFFAQSILIIYMFPAIVLALPLYAIFSNLGLRDNLIALLVIYPAMTIPVSLYMLRSYFQSLPKDIEEAGLIDGCNRGSVIWYVTLPLSMPAITSVALYVFMIAWNEFLFAFMMLDSPEFFTLSRAVQALNTQEVPRQFLAAGSIVITAPVMFLFFWFQKLLTGGLTAGSVKG